jgi:hypothetical protein
MTAGLSIGDRQVAPQGRPYRRRASAALHGIHAKLSKIFLTIKCKCE